MENLLKLLNDIEAELNKIGEWKSERSEDLDWWLPLSEYLQFITIPQDRDKLQKGSFPEVHENHLAAIETDWIRNPKWEKTAEAVRNYYLAIESSQNLPARLMAFREPFRFFKLLDDEQVKTGKKYADQLLEQAKDLFMQLPEHQDTLNFLISLMDKHLKHYQQNEVPPEIELGTSYYFSIIEFDPLILPLEQTIKNYQIWLKANPDNQRLNNPWHFGSKSIEIEVSARDVKSMFEQVFTEIGRTTKISGFKMGEAPINELKKNKSIRLRAFDLIRTNLMQIFFEQKIMRPVPTLANHTFRDLLAQFQPLCRLQETEPFKFLAYYNESLFLSLQNGT